MVPKTDSADSAVQMESAGEAQAVTDAVILAAGQGSRLNAGTPKPLLPILGVPLLARTLFTLKKAGITDAYIVVGQHGDRIRREIEGIERLKMGLHWVDNPRWAEPNGVSVLSAAPHLDRPFLLTMSDHILQAGDLERLREAGGEDRDLVLLVDRSADASIDLDDATKVALDGDRIAEIGKELQRWDAVDTGAFLATPGLMEALRRLDEEAVAAGRQGPSLSDGVRRLAATGRAWVLDGTGSMWQDVDTADDVRAAEAKLMAAWPKPTDGPVSRMINRPISTRISRILAIHTQVTPNQISAITLVMGLAAAWFAYLGGYTWWLASAAIFQLASILDGTDGELAILTFRASPLGAWVDTVADNVSYVAFLIGMTAGVWRADLPDFYLYSGAIGLGAAVLSLANINMYLRREGESGSALSVQYGYQDGDRLGHRVMQLLHYLGKRDLICFVVLVLALIGQLPLGLPIFGVGATLLLLPATLHANVSHYLRTRGQLKKT